MVPMPSTISPTRPDKFACRQLALAAKFKQALAHARDDNALDGDDGRSDHAKPEILHDDEDKRSERLAAEECRLDKGIAGKAAHRLDLILDHRGDFS